jgi:hypothetical protein
MTQHPLVPCVSLFQDDDARNGYRPETEREIFERIARTMREDQRRERRQRAFARLQRVVGLRRRAASGGRRVAGNH